MKRTTTKRTKAKRIEAWFLLDSGGLPLWYSGKSAADRRKSIREGSRYAYLVEADPLARLKEDVVKAARAFAKKYQDEGTASLTSLLRAVERLERKRR